MGEFVCKVADSTGRVFEQVEAAPSLVEARQKLAERGLFIYSIRPRSGMVRALRRRGPGAVRGTDFLIFNQQFNTLIRAGLPILRALDLLAERAASPRLRPLLNEVRDRVRGGALLSEAFDALGVFPRVYVTAVLAGEKSGNLTGVLEQYISYQRLTSTFRRRLLTSLIYPAILILVSAGILTYVTTFVVPRFALLFNEMRIELPFVTQVVLTLTRDFRPYVLAGAGLVALGAMLALVWSRTDEGGIWLDRWKLRVPFLGQTWIKFQTAQISRTLGTLLVGGTPLVSALETAAGAVASKLVSHSVLNAAERVREGKSLHESLAATGLVPELAQEMIEVGEATGSLAPMLTSVAEFYEEDVNLRLSALVAVAEPAILISTALVVGFILISLYLPIFGFALGRAG